METQNLWWLENAAVPSHLQGLCQCHPSAPNREQPAPLSSPTGAREGLKENCWREKKWNWLLETTFSSPCCESSPSVKVTAQLELQTRDGAGQGETNRAAASLGSRHWGGDGSSQPLPSQLGRAPASAEPSPGLQAEFKGGVGAPEVSGEPARPWAAGESWNCCSSHHPTPAAPLASFGAGARLRKAACKAREQLCTWAGERVRATEHLQHLQPRGKGSRRCFRQT